MSDSQRIDHLAIAAIVNPSSAKEAERLEQWCNNSEDGFPLELTVGLSEEDIEEIRKLRDAKAKQSPEEDSEWTLSRRYRRYINPDRTNVRSSTLRNRQQHIPKFLEFADELDISYASELGVQIIESYADEICERYKDDSPATAITEAKTSGAFIRYALKYAECSPGIAFPLAKDEIGLSMPVREVSLGTERAWELIPEEGDTGYASRHTTILALCWCTMLRIGEVRALNLEDFDRKKQTLRIEHRPEQETPIKNGDDEGDDSTRGGARTWPLPEQLVTRLSQYIVKSRKSTTDKYGNKPLFTTNKGRPSLSTLRRNVYQATSCEYADAPRDGGEDCDGGCDHDTVICPYSVFPHAVRQGSIEYYLDKEMDRDKLEYLGDVSIDVLLNRYDNREDGKKAEAARSDVEDCWK